MLHGRSVPVLAGLDLGTGYHLSKQWIKRTEVRCQASRARRDI
jgi:hypothetical protein